MREESETGGSFDDLPFHEFCAYCHRQFDGSVLNPTVTVVETEDERVLHSFCDEECFAEWAADR